MRAPRGPKPGKTLWFARRKPMLLFSTWNRQEAHVHRFFRPLMGIATVALIGAVSLVGPARTARAQGAPAQTQKKVKDQGEYDLFNGVTKETDPAKKAALLNTWKEKYPESDYKLERLVMLIQTYSALQQWPNVINAAKEALTVDPKDITSLYWITFLTPNLGSNSADVLDRREGRDRSAGVRAARHRQGRGLAQRQEELRHSGPQDAGMDCHAA